MKEEEYTYIGEANDYKYLCNLKGEGCFDRTQVFTDGEYLYYYSTKNFDSKNRMIEKKDVIKLIDPK